MSPASVSCLGLSWTWSYRILGPCLGSAQREVRDKLSMSGVGMPVVSGILTVWIEIPLGQEWGMSACRL